MIKYTCLALILGATYSGMANADSKVAYKTDVKEDVSADGTVKKSSMEETTDSAGTVTKSSLKETSKIESDGTKKGSSVLSSSTDPKGLGNKTTVERERNSKEDGRGSFDRTTKTTAVDAKGTENKKTVVREVDQDVDGATTSTYKERVETDPKGLMNKRVDKIERTVKTDAQGNVVSDESKKIIDGKEVQ